MEEHELKHYGVLGMKWGVRRTPEQLGHNSKTLNVSKDFNNFLKSKPEELEKYVSISKSAKEIIPNIKKARDAVSQRHTKKPKGKSGKEFSDRELRELVNRMQLERQYEDLTRPQIQQGKHWLDDALDVSGAILGTTTSLLTIMLALKKLK